MDKVDALMGFSWSTVTGTFEHEPGVVILERLEALHSRRYRSIRIPKAVFERVMYRQTVR